MKKKLTSKPFITKHKINSTGFTRARILTFENIFFLLINFLTRSLQAEPDTLFKVLLNKETPVMVVTKGAFSLARKKLGHKAFIELDKDRLTYFYKTVSYKKWQGFRLPGIDGPTVRLPFSNEIVKKYGSHDVSETGTPITYARLSQAYDVPNDLTLGAKLSTYSDNGHNLSLGDTAVFEKGGLALYDRDYASFWLFSSLLDKQVDFCARLKVGSWKVAKELLNSGNKEIITEIHPGKAGAKKCKALGLSTTPITLRFICIGLGTGEKEVLITSLINRGEYPYRIFSGPYQLRWPVEEPYKTMKPRLEIENFSGKSCLAINQDFYAKIFPCNLTTILVCGTDKTVKEICEKRKRKYRPNFTQALNRMKNSIVLLFCRQQGVVIGYLSQPAYLFASNLEMVRGDRSFNRNFRKSKPIYPMPYKNAF